MTNYEVRDGLGQTHIFPTRIGAERYAAERKAITWANVFIEDRRPKGITVDDVDGSHYERNEQDRIEALNAMDVDEWLIPWVGIDPLVTR